MGSCASTSLPATPVLTEEQIARKAAIERRAEGTIQNSHRHFKLLLLGAGECGKSTILKQMKILHLNGFTAQEKRHFKTLIMQNIIDSAHTVCMAMKDLNVEYEDPNLVEETKEILDMDEDTTLTKEHAALFVRVWADEGIQKVVKRRREFHLLDSAPYFFTECTRILESEDYDPTTQDILRCRLATTGIHKTTFEMEGLEFTMFDVGGQRGERKKWIHCFENVHAILYIASLVEYDQVTAEDRDVNCLHESLALFDGIINLPWFKEASILLFLNKQDLFEDKVTQVAISDFFPEYKFKYELEDFHYENGLKFMQDRYLERNRDKLRTVYIHITNATNTENINFVWKCAKHVILELNLSNSGLTVL